MAEIEGTRTSIHCLRVLRVSRRTSESCNRNRILPNPTDRRCTFVRRSSRSPMRLFLTKPVTGQGLLHEQDAIGAWLYSARYGYKSTSRYRCSKTSVPVVYLRAGIQIQRGSS